MRLIIAAFAMLMVGVAIGYMGGRKSGDAELERSVRSLALAQSAKEVALYTRLLQGMREGKQELVLDRIEILLDYSLIDLGTNYAPQYDFYQCASKPLALARGYRTTYPHKPSTEWAAKRLDAALSLKIDTNIAD